MPPDVVSPRGDHAVKSGGRLPPVRTTLRIHWGSGDEVEWTVRSFALDERLHAPYALEVLALTDGPQPDPHALLGARLTLEVARGSRARRIHGVVLGVELRGDHGDGPRVKMHAGPALALLRLSRRSRVFQGLTVVEIAQSVMRPTLTRHESALCIGRLVSVAPPRDYCVQYRETDLEFVLRVLAEEGITVMFDHTAEHERVVLVDDRQALPPAGEEPLSGAPKTVPALAWVSDRADEVPVESIRSATQAHHTGTGRWSASVWDWKTRPMALQSTTLGDDTTTGAQWSEVDERRPSEGEGTDGPLDDVSPVRARLQRARDEADELRLLVTSNATTLRAGSVFELVDPPQHDYGRTWWVTRVQHRGDAPHASAHGSTDDAPVEYANEVECQAHAAALVPAFPPRPVVHGVHTAIVTGPPGEVIHTDAFGRIRVRMLWDRQTPEDEDTSCWLRVALPWAGDGFGAVFIPRVGSEVVVSFIDGDPDRPLCTGGVYDGANMPPYPLPEHKTRTVLRTASTDGEGFNELSFEDSAGREEVHLHAQRNLREVIRSAHSLSVGASQRRSIGASRQTSIGKDDELRVAGDHTRSIDGDVTERIRGAYRLRVSDTPGGLEGIGIAVERGTFDVEAAEAIVLRCGACRLELHPTTIVLSGPQIVSQCPSEAASHSTTIAMNEQSIAVTTPELRERACEATREVDRRMVFGVGPGGSDTLLCLDGAATLRADTTVDLRASTVVAVGTDRMTFKGATCEVVGEVVGLTGNRVGIDADSRIEVSTPGQVNVRGQEKITLN